jgi:hypothetical protein
MTFGCILTVVARLMFPSVEKHALVSRVEILNVILTSPSRSDFQVER